MIAVLALVFPLALAVPAPAPQAPPPETLRRAEAALDLLGGRGFAGSYRLTTRAHVVATGEDGPENSLEVDEVTIAADGTRSSRLVQAVEDGGDVTAERAAAGTRDDEEKRSGASHGELDIDITDLRPL